MPRRSARSSNGPARGEGGRRESSYKTVTPAKAGVPGRRSSIWLWIPACAGMTAEVADAMARPLLVGILNITEDSFSDGGRYLDPATAIAQARHLAAGGADIVELGAAASNIAAKPVSPEEDIRRLQPDIAALSGEQITLSVDSFQPEVQRF